MGGSTDHLVWVSGRIPLPHAGMRYAEAQSHLCFRLSYTDRAEWLAARGVQVDPAAIYH